MSSQMSPDAQRMSKLNPHIVRRLSMDACAAEQTFGEYKAKKRELELRDEQLQRTLRRFFFELTGKEL